MQNIHDIHIHMRFYDQERVEKFLKTMADSGVTKMGMQALPYHSPINNLVMLYWKQKCTDIECTVFGGMHRYSPFEDEPYESQAKRLLDMGCEGIKLIDMCRCSFTLPIRRNTGIPIPRGWRGSRTAIWMTAISPSTSFTRRPSACWKSIRV